MGTIDYKPVFTFYDINKKQYCWKLILNNESFDYSQGSAYFTKYYKNIHNNYGKNKKPDNGQSNTSLQGWLHVPTIKDVLYCLLSDLSCGNDTFQDFCYNCGYDTDSITAFKTYTVCQENGAKLRKALTREQIAEFRVTLDNY